MGKLDSLEELFKSAPREYYMELPPVDIRAFLVRAAARRGFSGSQEYIEALYDMWRMGLVEIDGDMIIPNREALRIHQEYSLGGEELVGLREEISRESERLRDEGIM